MSNDAGPGSPRCRRWSVSAFSTTQTPIIGALVRPTAAAPNIGFDPSNFAPLSNVDQSSGGTLPGNTEFLGNQHKRWTETTDNTPKGFGTPTIAPLAERATTAILPNELRQDLGLDCPIRAGPNGSRCCGWKPSKEGSGGFPSFARVR